MTARCIPQVAIVMSSDEDLPRVEPGARFLRDLGIPFEMTVLSAYDSPDRVREFARSAAEHGFEVIVAASPGSNALACMTACYTTLPVIALPLRLDDDTSASKELAALLSSLETPIGYPIASVGFNDAENAACLAAQILGVKDHRVRSMLALYRDDYRRAARQKAEAVAAVAAEIQAQPPLLNGALHSARPAQTAPGRASAAGGALEQEEVLESELSSLA